MKASEQRVPLAVCLAIAMALIGRGAHGLSDPNDFCTGNPCQITSSLTADHGITLDFGNRAVELFDILTVGDDPLTGTPGTLTILAASFAIIDNGQVRGPGGSAPAGAVTIITTGDIRVDGTRATGAFRFPGTDGGTVTLQAGGDIYGAGKFNLDHATIAAAGGELIANATGNVNLTGQILAEGGVQGFGGTVDVIAGGTLSITGEIRLRGGESGGGSLDLFSEGNMSLRDVDVSAGGEFGDAGIGDILALGSLTMNGTVTGNGADNGENCGDAADLDITADGDITISGPFNMKGRGLDCSGGFLAIDGNAVQISAAIDLSSNGTEGIGGDLDISSIANMVIVADLRIDGPDGAGDLLLSSDSDMSLGGDILANGTGTFGSGASLVEIDSSGQLIVSGDILANGGSQGSGGDVSLDACSIFQSGTSTIDARATGGLIDLVASDGIVLQGTFFGEPTTALPIEINYGPAADPPDIGSATFNVPPTLSLSAALTPCALCASNAECDDGNPCTDDVCVPSTGCSNPANLDPCDDGNPCTTNDFCAFSVCLSVTPLVCDDGDVCTDDSCDPALGCQAVFNTAPCDDSDSCTENDTCAAGACLGSQIDCEDGNPCTDNFCAAGACQSTDNSAPCDDGDACTTSDVCAGGTCQPGSPMTCSDTDPCTTDSCDSGSGCVFDPVLGCADSDGDGTIDDEDVCTTLDWTAQPQAPPNQHPNKMRLNVKKLSEPLGEQSIIFKGFFNVAEPAQPIAPEIDGIHFALSDGTGVFYDVDVPAGMVGHAGNCGSRDGWKVSLGGKPKWTYTNKSGAFPPGCAPGSARGVAKVQIKDSRLGSKSALQAKIKVKKGDVDRVPSPPINRLQADLVMAAEPSPGQASLAAIAGQCAEGLITGTPISSSSPLPFCKVKFRNGDLDKLTCKGR